MKPTYEVVRHETTERLVEILCDKLQNDNKLFYRNMIVYYFSKVASMMHCGIDTLDRGVIPINCYAVNLATSGTGKGFTMNLIEDQVINLFREAFLEETFLQAAETNLGIISTRRSIKKNTDPDQEAEKVQQEFENLGSLAFSFDSGTTPAVKQMRHKLLMANAGSMNLEIDEIGSNLMGNIEVLETFLELFDVGNVKQKLTKNTKENLRSEDIEGRTPTNLLMFGTPPKLLNGGKTEEEFMSMLETGYARRCIFSYARTILRRDKLSAEDLLKALTDTGADQFITDLSIQIGNLADVDNLHRKLYVNRDTTLHYLQYKIDCEAIAESLPEHEDIRQAEIAHRYFKAIKIAGALAFIDGSHELTMDHLKAAITHVEESGEAFDMLLTRDRNYVKLAKYISDVNREVTHVDLVEDLPFYRGTQSQKADLMSLAIAYGYKNNIIIKRHYNDGIEFLIGETIRKTNLNELIVAISPTVSEGYQAELAPFDRLHELTQLDDINFTSHHFEGEKRSEATVIEGFNMLVFDVDGTANLGTVKLLLKDYTYHIYTTKRHTDKEHRFRLMLPMNYSLKMTEEDYTEFLANVVEWLPFEVDEQANQRSRKWATCTGEHWSNEGKLIDVVPFIPKTAKNDERVKQNVDLRSLDNLERWFVANTGMGNRNQRLVRYAFMLVDTGLDFNTVQLKLLALNNKIADKLDEAEILSTIMVSVGKRIHARDAGS